ncbi:hypothetical protein Ddc_19079 [Ditylenchus destructor]|nr:hypothetical protein Ddc_19079 [Ditylenchus destructor]
MIMDIFLDVIPISANNTFSTITGISPTVYTGQLLNFIYFLNPAVCSVYYSWRLTRKSNGLWTKICRVQQVFPSTTAI